MLEGRGDTPAGQRVELKVGTDSSARPSKLRARQYRATAERPCAGSWVIRTR